MKNGKAYNFLQAIAKETDLDMLDRIGEAAADRKRALAKLKVMNFDYGQTVRFTRRIRPAYLAGLSCKVVSINQSTVTVECPNDARYGRFSNAKSVRVPNTLLMS
jgi:hypothetical protein